MGGFRWKKYIQMRIYQANWSYTWLLLLLLLLPIQLKYIAYLWLCYNAELYDQSFANDSNMDYQDNEICCEYADEGIFSVEFWGHHMEVQWLL